MWHSYQHSAYELRQFGHKWLGSSGGRVRSGSLFQFRSTPPFRAAAPQAAAGPLGGWLGQIDHTDQRETAAITSAAPPGRALGSYMGEASHY